jgi:hypothetical protein
MLEQALLIDGWMSVEELGWLAETASTRSRIVEVGSWKGRSTKALSVSTPGRVFAVDHWRGSTSELETWHKEVTVIGADALFDQFCKNLAPEIASGKLVPIRQDCGLVAKTLGPYIRPDFVFIDAEHIYSSVRRDIEDWRAVCDLGAILSGHDYGYDVLRAVTDVLGTVRTGPGSIWYTECL